MCTVQIYSITTHNSLIEKYKSFRVLFHVSYIPIQGFVYIIIMTTTIINFQLKQSILRVVFIKTERLKSIRWYGRLMSTILEPCNDLFLLFCFVCLFFHSLPHTKASSLFIFIYILLYYYNLSLIPATFLLYISSRLTANQTRQTQTPIVYHIYTQKRRRHDKKIEI